MRGMADALHDLSVLLLRAGHQRGDAAHRAVSRRSGSSGSTCSSATRAPRSRAPSRCCRGVSGRDGGIGYWSAERLDERVAQRLRRRGAARRARPRHSGRRVGARRVWRITSPPTCTRRPRRNLSTPIARWQDMRAGATARSGRGGRLPESPRASRRSRRRTSCYRMAALLSLEDRARLAEVFARRKQTAAARRLIEPRVVGREGRGASRVGARFGAHRLLLLVGDAAGRAHSHGDARRRSAERAHRAARRDARRRRRAPDATAGTRRTTASAVTALAAFERAATRPGRSARSVVTLRDGSVLTPGATHDSSDRAHGPSHRWRGRPRAAREGRRRRRATASSTTICPSPRCRSRRR